jgi:single-stranded-DNA-specific exonuclease
MVAALKRQNDLRREIERDIHAEARLEILEDFDPEDDRFVVLAREGWHPGVIGIVASRIVEEFFRPTLLISLDGDLGKGSARSIPQVEICEALRQSSQCLSSFGGHAMAAGVQMESGRVDELRRALNSAVDVSPKDMIPEITVDGEYPLSTWTTEVLRDIDRLAPFGHGNPQPRFAIHAAEIVGTPRLMGSDEAHLSFHVRGSGASLRAVAFRMAKHHGDLSEPEARVSLVYQPRVNRWGSRQTLELMVDEIELASSHLRDQPEEQSLS